MLFPVTWSIFLHHAWIAAAILLATVVATVQAVCPRNLKEETNACFTSYSAQLTNMKGSPEKLCCGVDVETLRAFCKSYTFAVTCISGLRRACPESSHHVIEAIAANLRGHAEAGLHDMCADDSIIEYYAMYQSCFRSAGYSSERCFQNHFNMTRGHVHRNIRFLSNVDTRSKDHFCSNMRNVVTCVQKNVRGRCGDEAADLAAILVKPMVLKSTDCDYTVIKPQKTTTRPSHGNPAYISDEYNRQQKEVQNGRGNTAHDTRPAVLGTFVLTSLVTLACTVFPPVSSLF